MSMLAARAARYASQPSLFATAARACRAPFALRSSTAHRSHTTHRIWPTAPTRDAPPAGGLAPTRRSPVDPSSRIPRSLRQVPVAYTNPLYRISHHRRRRLNHRSASYATTRSPRSPGDRLALGPVLWPRLSWCRRHLPSIWILHAHAHDAVPALPDSRRDVRRSGLVDNSPPGICTLSYSSIIKLQRLECDKCEFATCACA